MDLKNKRDSSETETTEVCFVLPTYNEEKNIRQTVEGIFSNQILFPTHRLRVLVVDDNSSDGTQKKVTQLITKYPDLHMITGDKKGLGDAYKRGFLHALSFFKPDFVFQMDSDGQHDPKLIPAFIEQINAGYSLVVGSRFTEGGSLTDLEIHRKFIAWLGNFLVRYAGGVRHIRDCTSGYRCISSSYLERCNLGFLSTRGYSFQSSLICELVVQGAKCKEIPIIFSRRNSGSSKLSLRDQIEFILNIPRLGFHSRKDFIKYSSVGFSGLLVNLGSYIFLTRYLGMAEVVAPLIAIEISVFSSFLFHNFWTFKQRNLERVFISRLMKFHLVVGFGGIFNYITFFLMFKIVMVNDILAILLGIGVAAILNYLINSNWTWKK